MESRETSRYPWVIAVTLSIVLHGAIVLACAVLSGHASSHLQAQSHFLALSFVEEVDGGESDFGTAPTPLYTEASSPKNASADDEHDESWVATLRARWDSAPA